MTKVSAREKTHNTAIDFCEETISQKHFLESGWLKLCARLKQIRDKGMYEGRWDSFEDFLNDPQMGMDKSTASRMITIHEKLIVEYEINPDKIVNAGGWTKVAELLPVISDKKSAEEWLETASVLSQKDLRKEVRGKEVEGSIACKHKKTYEVVMRCCHECDYKEVIRGGK